MRHKAWNMGHLTKAEFLLFKKLNSPVKIQNFLERLPINFEEDKDTLFSPRRVLKEKKAHCFEGALFAAAALWVNGEKPLIMDLETVEGDDNHVVALFRQGGYWGAISKTNHAVLRYREPVYRTLRELAMSYFHEYFINNGKKTLRAFSDPLDLSKKKFDGWVTADDDLWGIDKEFREVLYTPILNKEQQKNLRRADAVEIEAGKLTVWKKK
ncbi:MAG: hypothetical protein Q8P86_04150 [bacterium]|nr:hypothetical protein [bacterium]